MPKRIQRNERPILFSGPMVRAILAGRKTQTRRVVKPQPEEIADARWDGGGALKFKAATICLRLCRTGLVREASGLSICPYGQPGDRLWVRESFSASAPEGEVGNWKTGENVTYIYRADDSKRDVARWWPSIHLPRVASRITLEITNVRVERLQEIHRRDVQREGFICRHCKGYTDNNHGCVCVEGFSKGWNSLNAKRGYSWESNPWVFVIEFRKT